jgi:hypothetical protein
MKSRSDAFVTIAVTDSLRLGPGVNGATRSWEFWETINLVGVPFYFLIKTSVAKGMGAGVHRARDDDLLSRILPWAFSLMLRLAAATCSCCRRNLYSSHAQGRCLLPVVLE